MNDLDKKLETLIALVTRAGGQAGIDPTAPDDVKKAFIQMIMDCPDCQKAIRALR